MLYAKIEDLNTFVLRRLSQAEAGLMLYAKIEDLHTFVFSRCTPWDEAEAIKEFALALPTCHDVRGPLGPDDHWSMVVEITGDADAVMFRLRFS